MSGSLAQIDLGFTDLGVNSGAGFPLSKPSPIDWEMITSSGAKVRLRSGAESMVVYLPANLTIPTDILDAGLHAAQEALDVLGISKMHFLGVPKAEYDHLLWWRDGSRIIVRWCDVSRLNIRVEVFWEKKKSDGTVTERSSDAALPNWHEAMRYFRYSQLGNDLYAAYRDAFLALESILSSVSPRQSGERERDWHIRVGRILQGQKLDFSLLVSGIGDPVEEFVDDQFKAHRCALFHAKINEQHFFPGVLADHRLVAMALDRLGRFLTQSAELVLGANNVLGVFTFAGIKKHVDAISSGLELVVSDDETVVDKKDTKVNPSGGTITVLPTTYLGVVDGVGYDFGFEGEVAVADMASTIVNTTASRRPKVLLTRGNVEQLDVAGADCFQYYYVLSYSGRAGLRGGFDL